MKRFFYAMGWGRWFFIGLFFQMTVVGPMIRNFILNAICAVGIGIASAKIDVAEEKAKKAS